MSSIIETQTKIALYDANSPWTSLTDSNLSDSIILALALFLTSIFIRSTVTLILYNQIRCSVPPDQKSYWAVSRVLIMETMTRTWLPRDSTRKKTLHYDKYKQRNRGQYCLSISLGVFLLSLEIILIILAAPGRKEFRIPSNRVIHLEIKTPEKPLLRRYSNEPCVFSEKISGINLQSEGQWSMCMQEMFTPPADSITLPEGIAQYVITMFRERELVGIYQWQNYSNKMRLNYKVSLNDTSEANVQFVGTDLQERFLNALETNLRMMENATKLFILKKLFHKIDGVVMGGSLVMNVSQTIIPSTLVSSLDIPPEMSALTILHQASAAVFNTRVPGPDTPALSVLGEKKNGTFPTEDYKEPVLIGFYNGPIITTLGSVLVGLVSFAIYLIVILIYRSQGNLGWEVLISYGRLYGDVLLSGPNEILKWSSAVNSDMSHSQESSSEIVKTVS